MPRAVLTFVLVLVAALSACRRSGTVSPAEQMAHQKLTNRDITFFYETSTLVLGGETRPVALPENDSAAVAAVVGEWLKGPRTATLARSLPPDTVLRGAYLLPEGNAIVDLGGPTLVSGWQTGSNEELIGVYSIVQTLAANFAAVKRVHLLVNGQVVETLAGHISIDRPLSPMPGLVAKP